MREIKDLKNMQNVPFKYTEKATTIYGTWYNGYFYKNGQKISGWVKSTDLNDDYISSSISNESKIIINDNGVIYDTPYKDKYTKSMGYTTGLKDIQVKVSQSVKIPFGLWYKVLIDKFENEIEGWIKLTDLS